MKKILVLALSLLAGIAAADTCEIFKTFRNLGVPEAPLKQTLLFYDQNPERFAESRYIAISDYSKNSQRKRFYLLDLETGRLRVEKVSHGSGNRRGNRVGDPNHDGMLDRCHHGNNINDRTNMTRAGFFQTANLYRSRSHEDFRNGVREWPYLNENKDNGLRMWGLSPAVNDEAMTNGIVMHGAWYNNLRPIMGRSYGCPAFKSKVAVQILPSISEGALYYSYTPQCGKLFDKVLQQVQGWEEYCVTP